MGVLVGVDPDGDLRRCGLCHGGVAILSSDGTVVPPAGRADNTATSLVPTGSYQVTSARSGAVGGHGKGRHINFKAPSRWTAGSGLAAATTRSTMAATTRVDRSETRHPAGGIKGQAPAMTTTSIIA